MMLHVFWLAGCLTTEDENMQADAIMDFLKALYKKLQKTTKD
jgi:hypothetical protein